MVDISVITVTWNSADTIAQCIESILADSAGLDVEIIVVDNESSDDTCMIVQNDFRVRLVMSQSNVGFARACNTGISLSTGRYVVLVNPDSQVSPGMFRRLIDLLDGNPQIAAVGPKILTSRGQLQKECGRKYIRIGQYLGAAFGLHHFFGSLSPYMIQGTETKPVPVEAISGACMMVRRDWIEEHGGLDDQMFMYVEDVDWCYRMGKTGFEIWYHPGAVLNHISGVSARKASLDWARRVHYGGQLALHRYFSKVYGTTRGTLIFLLTFPLVHMKLSVQALFSGVLGHRQWKGSFLKYCAVNCWMKVAIKAFTGDSYSW